LERVRAFLAHGFIDKEADAFGEAASPLFIEELQDGVQEFRIALVGHFGFGLDVFVDTPTGNQLGPPSTSFSRAERLHPSGVRLRSARYARLRSASPRRGGGGGKKDKLQKDFYTGFWRMVLLTPITAVFGTIALIAVIMLDAAPVVAVVQLIEGHCFWAVVTVAVWIVWLRFFGRPVRRFVFEGYEHRSL
jgi:hypothetical protein